MANQIITDAMLFAIKAHDGQYRDGDESYIVHPAQTAAIVGEVTNDPEIIAAAWLHDTIEDTDTTYTDLLTLFGERVANLVAEVTHEKNPDGSGYFPRLETQAGIMIKFADRLSNLSDMSAWSEKRKQAYLNKSKFWASSAKDAQPSTKD